MSKFKAIETEFKNAASLERALTDIGITFEKAQNVKVPDLHLYGYQGDKRAERASFRIDRQILNSQWKTGASNDLGFTWNGSSFDAIVSNYDQGQRGVVKKMNAIKQRYARAELLRQARIKGYFVKESTQADGSIRLQMARR